MPKMPKDITLDDIKEVFLDKGATSRPITPGTEPLDLKDLQEKIKSGTIKIQPAPVLHVEDLSLWVKQVLTTLGMSTAWVTDRSRISDFMFESETIELAVSKLGIDINEKDYIYQVAQRLKEQQDSNK